MTKNSSYRACENDFSGSCGSVANNRDGEVTYFSYCPCGEQIAFFHLHQTPKE